MTSVSWSRALETALDPAPRVALLHALTHPRTFAPSATPLASERNGTSPGAIGAETQDGRGDLHELEILFGLWRGAGKNVNLWDWLQGFRGIMLGHGAEEAEDEGGDARDGADGADGADRPTATKEQASDETEARLHAAFIRFCEEARMLGLVRAKGKGVRRGADDVVKGIGLV